VSTACAAAHAVDTRRWTIRLSGLDGEREGGCERALLRAAAADRSTAWMGRGVGGRELCRFHSRTGPHAQCGLQKEKPACDDS
jgi:hypothetical protein